MQPNRINISDKAVLSLIGCFFLKAKSHFYKPEKMNAIITYSQREGAAL